MKGRSNTNSGSPRDLVRMRTWKLDTLNGAYTTSTKDVKAIMQLIKRLKRVLAPRKKPLLTSDDSPEAPTLAVANVEPGMNMGSFSGLFNTSPDRLPSGPQKMQSSPMLPSGLMSPPPTTSPSPEPAPWSSAVGHASTGKSGRVIERLQGEIDRLNRDIQLSKARLDDSEKARENLATRNTYLQDRNSNYEQSQEASFRQLQRKDRMIDELRESLLRERLRVAAAETTAKEASAREEEGRREVNQARALAQQKETEYDTIVACRQMENNRNRASLKKLEKTFQDVLQERMEDLGKCNRLELIAEQQSQTVSQLEDLNSRANANFQTYRLEVDRAISSLREHVGSNDTKLLERLEEMTEVTRKMKWLMAVDRNVKYAESDSSPVNSPTTTASST